MTNRERFNKKFNDFMFEHAKLKITMNWIWCILVDIFSAFIFAFGFRSFIAPTGAVKLASGGVSGVSQIIEQIVELIIGKNLEAQTSHYLISILYFAINIPVLILAWKGIGRRFAILTLINIAFVSLFNSIIPQELVANFAVNDDFISRALFAGICTGLSSSTAFVIGASGGGFDVISYWFSIKKSTSIGKYSFGINGVIITVFTVLAYIQNHDSFVVLLYTLVYCFTSSLIIDNIVKRNKKAQIQIFTTKEDLPSLLISAFPHGCTVVDVKGAFSGTNLKMIIIDVSVNEVDKVIKLVRNEDEKSFVNVIPVNQVYGKFYIEPIK